MVYAIPLLPRGGLCILEGLRSHPSPGAIALIWARKFEEASLISWLHLVVQGMILSPYSVKKSMFYVHMNGHCGRKALITIRRWQMSGRPTDRPKAVKNTGDAQNLRLIGCGAAPPVAEEEDFHDDT